MLRHGAAHRARGCVLAFALGVSPPAVQQRPPVPQLPSLPVTQLDEGQLAPDLDAPRRLSLAFAEPLPIRDVLLLLVQGTPFSIALDPDVSGTFVGELKQVTLRQAIETVIGGHGLDYDVRGTLVHVFTARTETRFYEIELVDVTRDWHRSMPIEDGESSLRSATSTGDELSGVEQGIQTLLSTSGRVHIDRRAGLAQVTDYSDRLDRVGLYMEALHLRTSRQVRLQARLLEVDLPGASSVDWNAVRARTGGNPGAGQVAVAAADAAALQEAIAQQGAVRVIAAPDILALNNEAAVMRANTPDFSALTLTVIPQISADGFVQVSVSPSWAERTGTRRDANGRNVSAMRVSEADTVARIATGQTIVIAGLIHAYDVVQPSRGFAGVFGAQQHTSANRELVLLLTATVVGR